MGKKEDWLKYYLDENSNTFLNATESVKKAGFVVYGATPSDNIGFGLRQAFNKEINEYLNNNGWPRANYLGVTMFPKRMRWLKHYVTEGPTYQNTESLLTRNSSQRYLMNTSPR